MENNTNEDKPKNIWEDIAKRALRTGAHIPMVEEQFDSEKAWHGLHWNFDFNRRKKPHVVNKFAQIISDGSFASGSMIRIARNEAGEWVLVDGQHRLEAIAMSREKIWMAVVADEREAKLAYASVDNVGTIRTSSDAVSSLLGWTTKRWFYTVAAASIIASNFSRDYIMGANFNFGSASEKVHRIAGTIEKYKKEILDFEKLNIESSIFRGTEYAIHIVAAHYAPEIFWPYFHAAVKDDMLAKNSPEKRLAELRMMKGRDRESRFKLFFYAAACWNAKYKAENLQKFPSVFFGEERTTQVPKILGTPYPM